MTYPGTYGVFKHQLPRCNFVAPYSCETASHRYYHRIERLRNQRIVTLDTEGQNDTTLSRHSDGHDNIIAQSHDTSRFQPISPTKRKATQNQPEINQEPMSKASRKLINFFTRAATSQRHPSAINNITISSHYPTFHENKTPCTQFTTTR